MVNTISDKQMRGKLLYNECRCGNEDAVRKLLKQNAPTDCSSVHTEDTVLHVASSGGHNGIVQMLLEHGVSVNVRNNMGQTPLHLAASKNRLTVVKTLTEADGVDINITDNAGNTPLYTAVESGRHYAAAILISAGACADILNKEGIAAIHKAACFRDAWILKLLLAKGASTETKDASKQTPLHWACRCGFEEPVNVLLAAGASVNAKNVKGETPLYLAGKGGHTIILQKLIDAGSKVSARKKEPSMEVDTDQGSDTRLTHTSQPGKYYSVSVFVEMIY